MKKELKEFCVTITLDVIEINVTAKNATEARRKALNKFKRKSPTSLISKDWRTSKREIDVDEL